MFAEGFSCQKGAILCFGPSANFNTEAAMKISNAVPQLCKNILEESNVGETCYKTCCKLKKKKILILFPERWWSINESIY